MQYVHRLILNFSVDIVLKWEILEKNFDIFVT